MNHLRRFLLALILIGIPVQLMAAPVRDWSKVAIRTPSGAFVLGNPDARIKLVEYLSLTCPHCAHFEGEGIVPLTAKYIRPGLVSYEVRHALRDAFDFAGSMLARCNGPQAFFAVTPKIFAQQANWFARAQTWASGEQVDGLPPDQLLPKISAGVGFEQLFGFTVARANSCLTSREEQAILTAQAGEAWRRPGFPGTPTFLINDNMLSDVREWADLDSALAAALRSPSSPRKTRR
ncbi:MAG TPA: thioredoxin domain-containing protein [Sphingomonas sp.]|nr:thioredoxin domain-containing protein [Sphingomonas sp.]